MKRDMLDRQQSAQFFHLSVREFNRYVRMEVVERGIDGRKYDVPHKLWTKDMLERAAPRLRRAEEVLANGSL